MYHPMLTFAVAQTRMDDLSRDWSHAGRRRRRTPAEAHTFDVAQERADFSRRLARFAARRTRPTAA